MSKRDFVTAGWITTASVMPPDGNQSKDAGANLCVFIHKRDATVQNDVDDAYEISGPTSVQVLAPTQLVRLVLHDESKRNTEVFLLPVDSPFSVKERKVKGKRSGKKALEVVVTFEKGCKEGYDEFILTIPIDHDGGVGANAVAAALKEAAARVDMAIAWDDNNTSRRNSDVSDAMIIDQIGSPPSLLAPVPRIKSLATASCNPKHPY